MGQREVLEFLNEQRKKNPKKWFEVKEIKTELEKKEVSTNNIWSNLYKLTLFNQIQRKWVGVWNHKKIFRGKR